MAGNVKKGERSKMPAQYGYKGLQDMAVGDEASIARDRNAASGKAAARYPDKPITNIPAGSTATGSGGPAHKGSFGTGTPNA